MEEFKIKNFESQSPGGRFPKYHSLKAKEISALQNKLFAKLNSNSKDLLELVKKVTYIASTINDVDAEFEGFILSDTITMLNIRPNDTVYINWYRFDDIDSMKYIDLTKYFHEIWYPSSDDIDIFDDSLSWIVSIRHDGTVSLVTLP